MYLLEAAVGVQLIARRNDTANQAIPLPSNQLVKCTSADTNLVSHGRDHPEVEVQAEHSAQRQPVQLLPVGQRHKPVVRVAVMCCV